MFNKFFEIAPINPRQGHYMSTHTSVRLRRGESAAARAPGRHLRSAFGLEAGPARRRHRDPAGDGDAPGIGLSPQAAFAIEGNTTPRASL